MSFSVESLVKDGKITKVGERGIRGRGKADLRFWKVYKINPVHFSGTGNDYVMFTVDRITNHNIRGLVAVKSNSIGVFVGWNRLEVGEEVVIEKLGEQLLRIKNTGSV